MSEDNDATVIEGVLDNRTLNDGYDHVSVAAVDDRLELRLHLTQKDETIGLLIPGPRSSELQPWLYAEPEDIRDWASILGIWLDENLTAGTSHLATELRDGVQCVIAAPYGLRRADQADHERLIALAPNGWF